MTVPKSAIVLTSGLAGSSVLTSMFVKSGYWPGNVTIQKEDYDTAENAELVSLNELILTSVGFTEDRMMTFRPEHAEFVFENATKLDPAPFRAFVEKCNQNRPWIWKDPRLWLTIRWWRQFLDLSDVVFPVIYRDPLQGWISSNLRWKIRSFNESRTYRESIRRNMVDFAESEGADYLEILYEDLIEQPERVVDQINQLALSDLSAEDFYSVFRGTNTRRQHGVVDLIRATLIYLKNQKSARR